MSDTFDKDIEHRAREIFMKLLEIPDPVQGEARLTEACSGNPQLEKKVRALLAAMAKSDRLFSRQLEIEPFDAIEHVRGTKIDRYTIIEKLGEGGFGEVFRVQQTHPIRRELALKIIKPGMDSREIIKRFEGERQALAMMKHPHIAQFVDAGATANGRPYFVMELVSGKPISRYCDEKRLGVIERLGLFLKVCDAVQHAHQQGIIHRDLKPSNIVVIEIDGMPEPKIIDFGIAKSLQTRLTDETIVSHNTIFIGTPDYMSPEQFEYSRENVDTRTDVYSLGILLFELLIGVRPFEEDLRSADLTTVGQVIRDKEPTRPSIHLQKLGDKIQDVVLSRHTNKDSLRKVIHGDLDWITLKAIEKTPVLRYSAVTLLAGDIRRFLDDRPIEAAPPKVSYLAKKYIKRNRTLVIFACSILLALSVGLVLAAISYQNEVRQRLLTDQARERSQEIVSYLLEDLQPDLVEVGKRETLKEVARTAVQYYESLPPDMRDIKTVREHARALKILEYSLGWLAQAEYKEPNEADLWIWSVNEAWPLWAQVARHDPTDGEAAGEALFGMHFSKDVQSDWFNSGEPMTQAHLDSILAEYKTLEARFPDNLSVNTGIIRLLRGYASNPDNLQRSISCIEESCDRAFRMMEFYPDNDRIKAEYCTSMRVASNVYFRANQYEAALENFLKAHEVYKKQLHKKPSHWGYLVKAYEQVNGYIEAQPREALNAQIIPFGLDYIDRLRIIQPDNLWFNRLAGQMYGHAATSAMLDLRMEDSLSYSQESLYNWEMVAREREDYMGFIHSLGQAGVAAAHCGHPEQANTCLGELTELRELEGIRGNLIPCIEDQQIDIWMALKEWDKAEKLLIERINQFKGSGGLPGDPFQLAKLQFKLGDLLFKMKRYPLARTVIDEALAIHQFKQDLQRWDLRNEPVRVCAQNLATILALSGEIESAIKLQEWVHHQYDQYVNQWDGLLRSKLRLANAAYLLADLLKSHETRRPVRRATLLRQAASILNDPHNRPRLSPEDIHLRNQINDQLSELNE